MPELTGEPRGGGRRRGAHPLLLGVMLGSCWGVAARAWMRFITDRPEFTWSGTGFILGAAALVGVSLAGAHILGQAGRRGWRLLGLSVVLLGAGAGSVMLPTVVTWAVAIARTGWHRWARLGLVVLGLVPQVILVGGEMDMGGLRLAVALAWYLVLLGTEALALSIVFRPSAEHGRRRRGRPSPAASRAGASLSP